MNAGKGGALRTATFASMDADGSGEVDLTEWTAAWKSQYQAYPPEMQSRMLDKIEELLG